MLAPIGQILSDQEAMSWALEVAKQGEGFVAPNPVVGCSILDSQNRLIAVGAHLKFGDKHAEANALDAVKDKGQLEGAKVFVTLEPCSHEGKQPSCAHTLAKYSLASVTFAVPDPNPQASGGAEVLKKAGIKVALMSSMRESAESLAEVFLTNQTKNRCLFHGKVGTSLDGVVALGTGESQWITSEESRSDVQRLRGALDAVLIGRKTFEQDSPSLNSRHEDFIDKTNFAIVLDPSGKTLGQLEHSNIASVRPLEKVVLLTDEFVPASEMPIQHLRLPTHNGEFNLQQVGAELLGIGVCSVLIEGGAGTLGAFFRQKLLDRLTIYQSPSLLGSKTGVTWSSSFDTKSLNERIWLTRPETQVLGTDIKFSGKLKN